MTDTTIAAGEIREQSGPSGWVSFNVYPLDVREGSSPHVYAFDGGDGKATVQVSARTHLTPAEARDFARAILAAADWAERQGG